MKKKQTKKKEPQVVEIHIYVHQSNQTFTPYVPPMYPPGGKGTNSNYPITYC